MDCDQDYVFTYEARRLYCQIPIYLRPSFWTWFKLYQGLRPNGLIRFAMIAAWIYANGWPCPINHPTYQEFPQRRGQSVDLRSICYTPSYVWYKGIFHRIPYDFERIYFFNTTQPAEFHSSVFWNELNARLQYVKTDTCIRLKMTECW
jgi:hypothetical protein